MRFLPADFFSLSRSLWMIATPSSVSATTSSLTSPANLQRAHSAPSSRLLMKMLNRVLRSIDSWGAPLLGGLQLDVMFTTPQVWQLSHFSTPLTACSSRPHFNSLSVRILRKRVSKALVKSRWTISTTLSFSTKTQISSLKVLAAKEIVFFTATPMVQSSRFVPKPTVDNTHTEVSAVAVQFYRASRPSLFLMLPSE